jgi:hypothetical protein
MNEYADEKNNYSSPYNLTNQMRMGSLVGRLMELFMSMTPTELQDVPTPLGEQQRSTLERCKFSDINASKIKREIDTDCAICQSKFELTDDVTLLPCGGHHYFHNDCINQWLGSFSKKCPVCRENIEDVLKNNKN